MDQRSDYREACSLFLDDPVMVEVLRFVDRHRIQTLLLDGGLACSPDRGILNRAKPLLFKLLEVLSDPKVKLVSPTGFEPVLPP
jgi:hypothetical protein